MKTLQMPALSPTMEEGVLARWMIAEGDKVEAGDLIAEIETDKATMELEAEEGGIVAKLEVEPGTTVAVGEILARLTEATEKGAGETEPTGEVAPAIARSDAAATVNLGTSPAVDNGADRATSNETPQEAESGDTANKVKTPSVRAEQADGPAPTSNEVFGDIPYEGVKLTAMRKVIARRLTEAKQQIPHIYLSLDVQMDKLFALREELNAACAHRDLRLTVNDFIVKALAAALMEVPECNVQFSDDRMLNFQRADISVAVSIPGGLITPIVKGADRKGIGAISQEIKELASRAKIGKLAPDEYTGGTASLSNMGMYGIRQFQAIINPPQAMIMAVGTSEPRAVVNSGAIEVATMMSVTGSFDHRAIDGADGARLMKAFKELIEDPLRILA